MRHLVTLLDGKFHVHIWAKAPATGVEVDARSVHFNWLILIPLLVATRALGRGGPGWKGWALAVCALVALHIGFLVALTEYRVLHYEGVHPQGRWALKFLCQFYYSVGRVGLAVLIWMPAALAAMHTRSPGQTEQARGAKPDPPPAASGIH
jgi:hypothetical protein